MDRRNFLFTSTAALVASAAATPQSAASAPTLKVQRLSWAGVKLEFGDLTAFIDPFTSKEIWDGSWKMQIIPLEVTSKARAVTTLISRR
jgi:hypothetical protein